MRSRQIGSSSPGRGKDKQNLKPLLSMGFLFVSKNAQVIHRSIYLFISETEVSLMFPKSWEIVSASKCLDVSRVGMFEQEDHLLRLFGF